MRAVNLIPADERRGAGGAAGKSGGGAHMVLGVLAALVLMSGAYVLTGKSVDEKQADLARITREAEATEAQAQALASYTKFSALSTSRLQTVTQLADSRFDWAHALREVARVLPENAWLQNLTATTSPEVGLASGGGGLRGSRSVPAIEVQGCTTSQGSVAKMMARMRLIDGVTRVSLDNAAKGDETGGATSAAGAASGDCRGGHAKFPQFSMVVFFESAATVPVAPPAGASASTTTPASTSTTTPASTAPTSAPGGTTP
jgi:Tfp pilus assembly protein PilN